MSKLIGQTLLDRYHILEHIGRGGMAEVYKVWDARRSTHFAMKMLHEDLALDHVFIRRFKREATTLSKLQHPYIVRLYDFKTSKRIAFMILDYVAGETLKHKIYDAGGPISYEQIRNVFRSICGALQYAHQEGFVHCDIKPGNIMFDESGKVLLSDFGISRMTDAATATMVGVGTPVARIVASDPLKITAGVPERYALDVRTGTEATVTFDVLPEELFQGQISYVGSVVDPGNRTFPVELRLPNPGGRIKPEMVANVELVRRTLAEAMVIPQEALMRVEEGYIVFVVENDGGVALARSRSVELGPAQQNEVVVLSGIEPGDRLIIAGHRFVAPGQKVHISENE